VQANTPNLQEQRFSSRIAELGLKPYLKTGSNNNAALPEMFFAMKSA
jgi:hypothetical protein